jgi:hypothetical protein
MMMFQGRRGFARMTLAAGAGLSCLALAACGGSASSAAGGSAASGSAAGGSAAGAASTADPLAGLTAAKVQAETVADAKAASSLTLKGSLTQSGQGYTVDLGIKPGHGCAGTIGEGTKGSFKLIEIGKTVYLNPDDTFWKTYAGASADAAIALVGGRYLKGSTSDSGMASLAGLCDVSQLLSNDGSSGVVTKGAVTTLNGVRVLPLNSSDGTAYVTDTSKPDLVELTAPAGSKNGAGLVTVTTNSPVTLTAPPASQVVDGSKLGM